MFSRDYRIRETSLKNGTTKNKSGSNFTLITEQKPTDAKACETLNTHQHVNVQAAAAHVHKCSLPTATRAGTESNKEEAGRIAVNSSKGDHDGTLNPGRADGIVIQYTLFMCVCERENDVELLLKI